MQTEWGTMEEAARILEVSLKTVRRRIADGTIKASRFGPRLVRVDMRSLDDAGRPLQYTGGAAV